MPKKIGYGRTVPSMKQVKSFVKKQSTSFGDFIKGKKKRGKKKKKGY